MKSHKGCPCPDVCEIAGCHDHPACARFGSASGSEPTLRTYAQKPNLSRLEVLRDAVAKSDLRHLLQQDVLYALDELARFKTAQNDQSQP